ncbi:MAG TPA: patatin-like phospholipase family protein [Candidatus Binatia bacterium]|nr:patatin-like phospholipase family protein [Candidatus Binatia bacterium]
MSQPASSAATNGPPSMLGLVLTAGGARGAYQAGVLRRIGEIPALAGNPSPFQIVTGASAGAINGAMIAAGSESFHETTERLAELWSNVRVQDVYHSDVVSLTSGGLRWLQDLSLGGFLGGGGAQSLLDATPLRAFLEKNLPLAGIARSIAAGHLYAVAVSATCYYSGKSFTFIQGRAGHPVWTKSRRVTLPVELRYDHVLASAAIPIIFAPVRVETAVGDFYFGDGGLRLVTPFSPAIRLGAERVLAIGIRSQKAAEERSRLAFLDVAAPAEAVPSMRKPPLAQIFGVFLNAIFLDHLDTDLDHLKRMNELIYHYGTMSYGPADAVAVGPAGTSGLAPGPNGGAPIISEPMRIVLPFAINPSQDLAEVAHGFSSRMPRMVRFAMEGLGSSKAESADLLSYLLFDSQYTRALIDIGYRDASEHADRIEAFLLGDDEAARAGSAEP